MAAILIKNGRVIDPSTQTDKIGDLFIENGTIVDRLENAPQQTIDAAGKWVVPGLIDVHVHLREPGFEHKETIETGVAAAAAGGFTQVVAMPNTNPTADNVDTIRYVMDKARALRSTRVIQSCAITKGRKGTELVNFETIMKQTGVTVFTDDGDGVSDDAVMEQAMQLSASLHAVISQHSEYSSISKKAAMHEGEVSKRIHVAGQPIASEDKMVLRDIELAKKTGGHIHVSHISSANAVQAVREAKAQGVNVTAEVTPHHLHLTDETVLDAGTIAKVAPPLRPGEHVLACRDALADGTIDVIATDHAPHTLDDKAGTIDTAAFGMVGLEISVPVLLDLVKQNVLTPMRMIDAMSTAPARVFGLSGGTLQPGVPADITIIDPDMPHEIDPRTFKSKGINTPFAGFFAPGKSVVTIVDGNVVYSELNN
ncbi:MAG: dihydroorotase [Deltaproteobacteria bacterium]|nr:dihydroorotase [Deltaproteobacteria bacterium]MBN2671363.1 dihydroorotase [Deltaproteobacteria bacterium]